MTIDNWNMLGQMLESLNVVPKTDSLRYLPPHRVIETSPEPEAKTSPEPEAKSPAEPEAKTSLPEPEAGPRRSLRVKTRRATP